MNANKDPLTVLAAFRAAAPRLKDPHLWCCYTDDNLLRAVRSTAEGDPVLAGRVHFLGELPHERVQVLLRAADFLMLGSYAEGSGYAVIESLACGTPPLVTDIPSFRKLTARGRVGALSPPGDSEAMARALLEWTARPRGTSRALARSHFEAELSFEAIGKRLQLAYETLLTQHRRPKSVGRPT
jgi:glycosyltransferase involved in cell wall biosynthesis